MRSPVKIEAIGPRYRKVPFVPTLPSTTRWHLFGISTASSVATSQPLRLRLWLSLHSRRRPRMRMWLSLCQSLPRTQRPHLHPSPRSPTSPLATIIRIAATALAATLQPWCAWLVMASSRQRKSAGSRRLTAPTAPTTPKASLPTQADLAYLRKGDVYYDTTASNVLKIKV